MRVQSARAAAPAPRPAKAVQATPPVAPARRSSAFDSFDRVDNRDWAKEIAGARAAVAALAQTPSIPLSNKDKTAWLEAAKKRQAAADAGLDVLGDAEWEKKGVSSEELDKARDLVLAHADKIVNCEERAGLRPLPKPFNPFRPLFGVSNGLRDDAGRNPLSAILYIFLMVPAMVVDLVDLVTRPVQVVAWPFAHAWRGIRQGANKVGLG